MFTFAVSVNTERVLNMVLKRMYKKLNGYVLVQKQMIQGVQ